MNENRNVDLEFPWTREYYQLPVLQKQFNYLMANHGDICILEYVKEKLKNNRNDIEEYANWGRWNA